MRSNMRFGWMLVLALVTLLAGQAAAKDVYYDIALVDLKVTAGELPKANESRVYRSDPRWEAMTPQVVFDNGVEGYVAINPETRWESRSWVSRSFKNGRLLVRAPADKEISGVLRLPANEPTEMTNVRFTVPPSAAKETTAEKFYDTKLWHYTVLHGREIPGTAWFNHQIRDTQRKLNQLGAAERSEPARNAIGRFDNDNLYALFSGSRAISENLQIDRALRETKPENPSVPIDSLQGITIAEIDWKPLLKDVNPKLDPLAKSIPADQHAIFFPTFEAAIKLSDEAKGGKANLLSLAEPRSEDAMTLEFYQRQLGLPLSVLARALGGKVIGSVAVTGSDPYFRVGTDVAVILESKNAVVVMAALLTQVQNSAAKVQRVTARQGEIDGVVYQSFVTPNRHFSSYIAQLGNAVVVTNSLAQLENLVAVFKGKPSLASLDEYKFFRQRYPLGDADETAFVFLSDATIRRWCSPRWRIASARRTYAAAALTELTALYAHEIGPNKIKPGELQTDLPLIDPGTLRLTTSGIESSTYGGLAWMTPIVELPIDKATRSEAESYKIWRDNYQSNWRWAFDPIGLRLNLGNDKLAADLTVMPLIANSDYRWPVGLSRGAAIAADGADRHDSLLQFAMAINTQSELFKQLNTMAASLTSLRAPGGPDIEPFSWLGESISLYIDEDPIWDEVAKLSAKDREKFYRKNAGRFPVAIYCDVGDPLRLTAFLTALRALIEPAAPGMLLWETFSYRDEAYVRLTPTRQGRAEMPDDVGEVSFYYAPSGDGIVFTANEATLKRAIDRRLQHRATKEAGETASTDSSKDTKPAAAAPKPEALPWIGKNFCLHVDRKMFHAFNGSLFAVGGIDDYETMMQMRSWSNLPILNEWKQMFPDEDPVKVHQRMWSMKLVCPGGGEYVWNDEWKTMESTVYGHPGRPKHGPEMPAALDDIRKANFGITFEEQGLRARMELLR